MVPSAPLGICEMPRGCCGNEMPTSISNYTHLIHFIIGRRFIIIDMRCL